MRTRSATASLLAGSVSTRHGHVLEWIHGHQAFGWLCTTAYFVLVVTTHDMIQNPALAFQQKWGFELVHYVIVAVILAASWILFRRIRNRIQRHPDSRRLIWTGLILLCWSVLVHSLFMVRSIETIHYVQYLLLALALAALLRNPLMAVLIATTSGVLDEGWQYFYLHAWQPYYDFNDVVMNTTGALQGAWLYALFRPRYMDDKTRVRPLLWSWASTAVLVFVFFATGIFTVYQEESGGIPLHRRTPPTADQPVGYLHTEDWGNSWWRIHPYPGVGFLFLLPLGVLAVPRQLVRDPDTSRPHQRPVT